MILLQIIFINHLLYSLYIYIHIYVEIFSYCNKKNLVGSCRYHVFYCGHHHHRIANLIKDLYDEDDIVQQKKKIIQIYHSPCTLLLPTCSIYYHHLLQQPYIHSTSIYQIRLIYLYIVLHYLI